MHSKGGVGEGGTTLLECGTDLQKCQSPRAGYRVYVYVRGIFNASHFSWFFGKIMSFVFLVKRAPVGPLDENAVGAQNHPGRPQITLKYLLQMSFWATMGAFGKFFWLQYNATIVIFIIWMEKKKK